MQKTETPSAATVVYALARLFHPEDAAHLTDVNVADEMGVPVGALRDVLDIFHRKGRELLQCVDATDAGWTWELADRVTFEMLLAKAADLGVDLASDVRSLALRADDV